MKQIKKIWLTIVIACLLAGTLATQAQEKDYKSKKEKIESMKIAFITQKLELSREEAQKFWPVYNEYDAEKDKVRSERYALYRDNNMNLDKMTDEEVTEFVDNQIIYRQRELDLKKKYHAELKGIFPIRKVALLYKVEHDFKKHLIKEAQCRTAH